MAVGRNGRNDAGNGYRGHRGATSDAVARFYFRRDQCPDVGSTFTPEQRCRPTEAMIACRILDASNCNYASQTLKGVEYGYGWIFQRREHRDTSAAHVCWDHCGHANGAVRSVK